MRKVELTIKEDLKYKTIKKLVETNGNKKRASVKLNCTVKHVNRMICGYNEKGKGFFSHGNHDRKPKHAFSEEFKIHIADLYTSKYWDMLASVLHLIHILMCYQIKRERL